MILRRRVAFPVLAIIGFLILCAAAPDGKFNGADLLGWILLVVGLMRVMHPVPHYRGGDHGAR